MLRNPKVTPYQINNMLRKLTSILDAQDITELTSDTVDFYIRQMHKNVDPVLLIQFLEIAMSSGYKLSGEDLDGFRIYLMKNDMAHKEIGKVLVAGKTAGLAGSLC